MSGEFEQSDNLESGQTNNANCAEDPSQVISQLPQGSAQLVFFAIHYSKNIIANMVGEMYLALYHASNRKMSHDKIIELINSIVQDGGIEGIEMSTRQITQLKREEMERRIITPR